jgi:hypothetical protein
MFACGLVLVGILVSIVRPNDMGSLLGGELSTFVVGVLVMFWTMTKHLLCCNRCGFIQSME